jgi:hypothetical protein
MGVDEATRLSRSRGLLLLGEVFRAAAGNQDDAEGLAELKKTMVSQMGGGPPPGEGEEQWPVEGEEGEAGEEGGAAREVDVSSLSMGQLKEALDAVGVNYTSFVEKREFQDALTDKLG